MQQARPPPQIVDRNGRLVGTRGNDRRRVGVGEALDHAQAEPHRERSSLSVDSNMQSQREALTQTGRTSAPCVHGVDRQRHG
jgi:hypothetical protein